MKAAAHRAMLLAMRHDSQSMLRRQQDLLFGPLDKEATLGILAQLQDPAGVQKIFQVLHHHASAGQR